MDIVGLFIFLVLVAGAVFGIYKYSKAKADRKSYGGGGWTSGPAEDPLPTVDKDKTKK